MSFCVDGTSLAASNSEYKQRIVFLERELARMEREVDYAVALEERDAERMEQIDALQEENERIKEEMNERINKMTLVGSYALC